MNEHNNSVLEDFGYEQELNRVMDLKALVFFGLAYLGPGAIFTTYGLVTCMTHGMLALTYVVATAAMLFTALSYSHMVKAYPISGSVYTYVTRSIHPYLGFLSGWAILMDYLLLPVLNFVAPGIFLSSIFPAVPPWVIALTMILLVTLINCRGIQITSLANTVIVIVSAAFVVAVVIFSIKWLLTGNGSATLFDLNAFINYPEFSKPEVGFSAILSGASILALSFLGFDSVTTVSEEAIEPEKNVGKAILIVCLGAGLAFILISYIFQLAWPEAWQQFSNAEAGASEYIFKICGSVLTYILVGIIVVGAGGCAIASQSSVARILYVMGRDGVLPKKFFGYIHPKYKTPVHNILLVAVISLSGLFMNIAKATSLINFGALAGFIFVNLSVIAHYYIRKKHRGGTEILKYLILPLMGAVICLLLWLNLDVFAKILGFSWFGIGFIWLTITTKFFRQLPPDLRLDEPE